MSNDNLKSLYSVFNINVGMESGSESSNNRLRGLSVCSGLNTTPEHGFKRNNTLTAPSAETGENQIKASLAYIKSMLKTTMQEARTVGGKTTSSKQLLMKLLEDMYDIVAPIIKKRGKLSSLCSSL